MKLKNIILEQIENEDVKEKSYQALENDRPIFYRDDGKKIMVAEVKPELKELFEKNNDWNRVLDIYDDLTPDLRNYFSGLSKLPKESVINELKSHLTQYNASEVYDILMEKYSNNELYNFMEIQPILRKKSNIAEAQINRVLFKGKFSLYCCEILPSNGDILSMHHYKKDNLNEAIKQFVNVVPKNLKFLIQGFLQEEM